MDSDSNKSVQEEVVDVVLEVQSVASTTDPPLEEWSSLLLLEDENNEKKTAPKNNLKDPGSGEVCAEYIAMSDSSIFRHPYYNYPPVQDPGIKKALLEPDVEVVYYSDGQDLYLALCKEMSSCPVRMFHRQLLEPVIDLKYYGVDPKNIRAMAEALKFNRNVKIFNLKDNFLTMDASYHLGDMLSVNTSLVELNLDGCRIGPAGAKRLFEGLVNNSTLRILNLNRNQLTDLGGEHLAEAIFRGINIKEIYLKYNNLGSKTATALAVAFETFNKLSHIDLSWNNFFSPAGTVKLLKRLEENESLEYLNTSWNSLGGITIANALQHAMMAPNMKHLDLNNNKLQGEAIDNLIEKMTKAKKLETLNLSYNPMTPEDALMVITKMKFNAVKVKHLLMDGVNVNNDFLLILERIKRMKSKKDVEIRFGRVVGKATAVGRDPRDLLLSRADYIGQLPKENKVDVALVFLKLEKENIKSMLVKDLKSVFDETGVQLDQDLIEEFATVFPGPKAKNEKTVNISNIVDYIKRKWPDKQLPPTPPLEPEKPKEKSKKSKEKLKRKK